MAARKAAIDEYRKKQKAGELSQEDIDDELELADNIPQTDNGDSK